jgi:hypothetical protein
MDKEIHGTFKDISHVDLVGCLWLLFCLFSHNFSKRVL